LAKLKPKLTINRNENRPFLYFFSILALKEFKLLNEWDICLEWLIFFCRKVRHLDVDLQLVSTSLKSLEISEQTVCYATYWYIQSVCIRDYKSHSSHNRLLFQSRVFPGSQ